MYALKMVGLTVLAGFCILGFAISYNYFHEFSDLKEVRKEALDLHKEIEYAIITGNSKKLSIKIPKDYSLSFNSNKLTINGNPFPDEKFDMIVSGPSLSPVSYPYLFGWSKHHQFSGAEAEILKRLVCGHH
ncbi:hypothetical protein AKJ50_02040 [candidate division MSBL1 archaeon SCGC-AAA382A13]|uniref:Uncharacterized protein n=1 Tax=candidate division MSBL1 archaeon SCGC-AAA382A13 TaxID=1698279 RepID=A0A133VE88_9EURY|nr:hypothetical protein AKJ50_02040 [candidate division MSBL1 archaeon SCGC-AAA382A13]